MPENPDLSLSDLSKEGLWGFNATSGKWKPVKVNDAGELVTTAGAGGGGGFSQQDETAFTEGTTPMVPIGGVLNDTITSDPTEDQAAAVRITAKRGLHANLRNVAGAEVGVSAAPLRTDPTGTTAQPVTDNGGTLSVDDGAGSLTVDGTVGISGTVDVSDRDARLAGRVKLLDTGGLVYDARDMLDRAGRLVGVVYGSQGQQLVQTPTNFNQKVEVAVGATLIDPRDVSDRSARLLGVLSAGNNNIGDVDVASIAAGTNRIGSVRLVDSADADLTTTKFANPAGRYVAVVVGRDLGRAQVMLRWTYILCLNGTSALTNWHQATRGAAALAAANNLQVSAGKTLRITQVMIQFAPTSATRPSQAFAEIRQATTVANTSPIIWSQTLQTAPIGTLAADIPVDHYSHSIPEGLDVAAGQQITFTVSSSAAQGKATMTIIGYES